MKELIVPRLAEVGSFDEIVSVIHPLFEELKSTTPRIGYVSGIISSKGVDKIPVYITRLEGYTEHIRTLHQFPIFSATDIFSDQIYERVGGTRQPENFIKFWRDLFNGWHVTDMFMTPQWNISIGAQDEYEIAKSQGMRIHFLEPVEEIELLIKRDLDKDNW